MGLILLAIRVLLIVGGLPHWGLRRDILRAQRPLGVLVLVGLTTLPAVAAFTPEEPWDSSLPMNEFNLYEIYNTLYDTSFTTNSDLDPLQVGEGGLLPLSSIPGVQSVTVEAVAYYAWLTHELVMYESDGGGGVSQELLFGGIHWDADTGIITDGRYSATFTPTGDFGFYDYAHVPDANYIGFDWFSQPELNLNGEDHLLLYSTPAANTFMVAWEDMPWVNPWPGVADDPYELNSDRDYNDLILEVRFNVVPEPATMLLLGLGIAGLAVWKARKTG